MEKQLYTQGEDSTHKFPTKKNRKKPKRGRRQ
jgi:hypothetical protein